MRSSVSVILSSPAPDQTMSYPDYQATAQDHHTVLVLVRHIGQQLKLKGFNKLYERISRIQHIRVQDSQGNQRAIWIRYRKQYPIENNDWGDFQTHRRVLGLICIGRCTNQVELNELCRLHESLKVKYSSTLYDSRCIVIGLHPDGTPYEQTLNNGNVGTDGHSSAVHLDQDSGVYEQSNGNVEMSNLHNSDRTISPNETCFTKQDSGDSGKYIDIINSNDNGHVVTESFSTDSVSSSGSSSSHSLTNSSVSKSTATSESVSPDNPDNTPVSPVSSSSSNKSGNSQTSSQKSSRSSPKKHLNNVGKPFVPPSNFKTRALYYATLDTCDTLETDVQEFLSNLFWVLESKRLDKSHEKQDKVPLLCAPFERKDFVGLDMDSRANKRRCIGRAKKQLGDLCLQAGLPGDAVNYYQTASEMLKSCNDWLWLASCFEGLCAASVLSLYPHLRRQPVVQRNASLSAEGSPKHRNNSITTYSLPNGLDPIDLKQIGKLCLSPAEIIDKYNEAVVHYSKYRNAGIIETEASIKAVQVLLEQNKLLVAADFLQNVVFINLQLSDEEKIQRFAALSDLYMQIGFKRKAGFFKRVAAMRCVAPQNPNPSWSHCYELLFQTLDGYRISVQSTGYPSEISNGWPALQCQILQELCGTARKMGNHSIATRHMTFLVHSMFPHLSPLERRDFAQQMDTLTQKSEGLPVPLPLDNGKILPPVNLLSLPVIKSFQLMNPAPHLRPQKIIAATLPVEVEYGPFIFSPLRFDSLDKVKSGPQKAVDFQWVQGDVCEVSMQVINPMPLELKVLDMGLLTEGVNIETFPSSLSLPAESGPYPVKLLATPQSTGQLKVLGYMTSVLGVKSNCRLKSLPVVKLPYISVNVVPTLPQVQVTTSLPKSATFSTVGDTSAVVTSASLSMFAGESQECTITISNTSDQPVEWVDLSLESQLDREQEDEFFRWSSENILSQLPIPPGGSASVTVYVYATGDFLLPGRYDDGHEAGSSLSGSQPTSLLSGPSSFTSRLSVTPSARSRTHRTESNASISSARSGSSIRSESSTGSARRIRGVEHGPNYPSKTVEAQLRIRYSGGPGYKNNFCRVCSVAVNVEVLPSLYITKWDVLPAETPTECYLVLDVLNATSQEMMMFYTTSKKILIESGDTCRVPIPLERCPLSKLSKAYQSFTFQPSSEAEEEMATVCSGHVASLVDLQWTLLGTETGGKASVSGITWNPVMLDLVRMAPVQFDVMLNSEAVKLQDEMLWQVGTPLPLDVTLTNHLDRTLQSVSLAIQCYQDHQNGYCNYRLESRLALHGVDRLVIPQIPRKGSFHHHCGLTFFTPGLYKLDIQCTSGNVDSQMKYENVLTPGGHIWKYTPPIEISVTES